MYAILQKACRNSLQVWQKMGTREHRLAQASDPLVQMERLVDFVQTRAETKEDLGLGNLWQLKERYNV
jgi:hypothetical protein